MSNNKATCPSCGLKTTYLGKNGKLICESCHREFTILIDVPISKKTALND